MHTNLNLPNMGESPPPVLPSPLLEHPDVPHTPLALQVTTDTSFYNTSFCSYENLQSIPLQTHRTPIKMDNTQI